MNDGALVGLETIDGMTEACATRRHPAMDAQLAVHRRHPRRQPILAVPHCVTEAGPAGPRQLDQVLSALLIGAQNNLGIADIVTASPHLDACAGRTLRSRRPWNVT